ncbi:MAG TPA: hypothetical protein VGN82_18050 [Bosea sp. (in: a-proteobacteria)]|jgi:hypothetical protein|uniref:hypothetical protein n=1 Tax=Bosea sp. (in: a-proteobacteria) TaxID=1871050 RepID=UPI002E14731C|nr:hypothetical protein [Bosea sp. (in: a-proteobacteria)]
MAHKNAGDPKGRQPEALATFAASARNAGHKPDKVGLTATPETAPIPTSSQKKAQAATKVLREGVLKRDQGAEEAIDALPDRTRSR